MFYFDVIRFEKKVILFSKSIVRNKKGFIFAPAYVRRAKRKDLKSSLNILIDSVKN